MLLDSFFVSSISKNTIGLTTVLIPPDHDVGARIICLVEFWHSTFSAVKTMLGHFGDENFVLIQRL